jgi:aminopeptidase N
MLRMIPEKAAASLPEKPAVVRAKSLLFFYALQDRYGREVFRKAISHMLYARRERGFELSDLIAAFEQETHQNAAEFVRLWMKRPGVPEEFRARYRETAEATA